MRTGPGIPIAVMTVVAALMVTIVPVVAQDYEELERPPHEDPVEGFTRTDGTIVLRDADFCSHLLGAIWGVEGLTPVRLIDRTRRQRRARRGAFLPASDEAVLGRCAEVINAYRTELADDDPLAPWARSGPVVPEAFADLLPADLVNDPLAEPDPIGDGSRTSGFGSIASAPFGLSGGAYFVQVDAADCEAWSGSIRGVRDPSLEHGPVLDRAYLYDVIPATYYWDVAAPDCEWSVDLVTVELGPEPTPTPVPRAVVPLFHGDPNRTHLDLANPEFVPVEVARQALLDLGLVPGECSIGEVRLVPPGRVLAQDPPAGTLLELGETVDVVANSDCDVFAGDRVIIE